MEEEVVVGAERERKRKGAYFTENTMLRGSSVDKVLNQVLADSEAEGEYSPSDDGVQTSDVSLQSSGRTSVKTHGQERIVYVLRG